MYYLEQEEDDGEKAHPGVEAVEVWHRAVVALFARIFAWVEVVRVEHRFQSDHDQDENRYHDSSMDQLQFPFPFIAEHAVHQDA